MRLINCLTFAAFLPLQGHAQVVGDAEAIAALMEAADIQIELDQASSGNPLIKADYRGIGFSTGFFDCKTSCASIRMVATYPVPEHAPADAINEWNGKGGVTSAYIDEWGAPVLTMFVKLTHEGVGRKNFTSNLEAWKWSLEAFPDFINR